MIAHSNPFVNFPNLAQLARFPETNLPFFVFCKG